MVCNVITADKANRLFWLGRYAQRVYISLHLLRRYYDKVIDGDIANLKEYYDCLGVDSDGQDEASVEFQLSQLYDIKNGCSIATSLNEAMSNGIVLRRDITSESLSYVEMSRTLLNECSSVQESNITHLQPVTDYMLAFFGSIEERVFDDSIRNFLRLGRLIESIDLRTRFNYPYPRIEELYIRLKEILQRTGAIVNSEAIGRLELLISESAYQSESIEYRAAMLSNLNKVVSI
ncbi:MAG: alpha-E domain-containing protein [Rikenellaceae bacterium]